MMRAWRPAAAALAVGCLLFPGASVIAQQQADSFVTGAEKAQRGEYDRAVDDLLKAAQQEPNSSTIWYYLGMCQFEMVFQSLGGTAEKGVKDYSEAEKSLTKAMQLAPSAPGPRLYLGRICEEREAYADAIRWYTEELALPLVADVDRVRLARARAACKSARNENDYAAVLTLLKQVTDKEPKYVEALYYTGVAQAHMKEYALAVKNFETCLAILNEWTDKIYRLLRLEYAETDPDKPSKIINNWSQLRMELWNLRTAPARPDTDTLEQVEQQYGRAQSFALDMHMWPELNKALGDAHLGLRGWAQARIYYRRAMRPREGQGSEDDVDAWTRIGRSYFLNGKDTFEHEGLLLLAIELFNTAEGDRDVNGNPEADPTKWEGFARALHVAGVEKDGLISSVKVPPVPDKALARTFDGLGELYLYEANTYQSDPPRGIRSHTQEDALKAFDKALRLYPGDVLAMLHKARALCSRAERVASSGEDLAEYMTRKAAQGQPLEGDWEALLTPQEHYDLAVRLLRDQALAADPQNPELYAELGRAYVAMGKYKEAEDASQQALHLQPDNVIALNTQGLVQYYGKGDFVAAASAFAAAIKVAPKDFQSYLNLGNSLYGLHSWDAAQREYAKALALIPQTSVANTGSQRPYLLYLIARTQHEQKMYDRAIETLGQALKLRTYYYDAERLLAACYAGRGEWRAAQEALQACLKNAPNDRELARTHAQLGQVYEVQAQFQEAIVEYRMALAKDRGNVEANDGLQRLGFFDQRGKPGSG